MYGRGSYMSASQPGEPTEKEQTIWRKDLPCTSSIGGRGGEGWAVVREGNKRATSTHPTQSEAAESGRDLARRDKSEFFLHARDGQIREHRDYREGRPSADEGIVDTVSETVEKLTDVVGGTTGVAVQAAGGASQETESTADRDQDDSVANAA